MLAMNASYKPNRGKVTTQPLETYDLLIHEPWLAQAVEKIRKGDTKEKDNLPFRCAHYYGFLGDHRTQKDADPKTFLFQTTVDVDDPDYVNVAKEKARELDQQLGKWHGKLLHMEYSARHKLHIDIRLPLGMTIEETQREYCQLLGIPYDTTCVSPERFIYITPATDEIYRSPDWYRVMDSDEWQMYWDNYPGHHSLSAAQPLVMSAPVKQEEARASAPATPPTGPEPSYHGIPFPAIIAEYWRQNNNGKEPTEGDRNTLTFDLACQLRHLTGFDRDILDRVIPNYDGFPEAEKLKCIDSALNEPRRYMPAKIKNVVKALEKKSASTTAAQDDLPPEMPKKLPPLIKLLVSRTPEYYRPAVANAVFPALGIHPWKARVGYIDNIEHEFTLMNVLMAGTGSGKDCITQPINHILADIRQRDQENWQRLKAWKEECSTLGANKTKPKRPEGLIIQEIHPDITNPAFVLRLADTDGHFLYCKMNEIEQFNNLRGSAGRPEQFQIMCLAFDPNNQYGQTRASAQSVEETVTIRFNWNASTTINKGRRYFHNVLIDGPISRINFCTIPERPIGSAMPVYGSYDEAFDAQLKPFIDNLNRATGLIDCPPVYRLAKKLDQENKDYAIKTQSRVFENLSFRANVIAYLKACLLYIAQGRRWTKTDTDFIRWSLRYDLWCKMQFFGDDIEEANQVTDTQKHRGPRNLLELLPGNFTIGDAQSVRCQQGMSSDESSTRKMVNVWLSRKYILRNDKDSFTKAETTTPDKKNNR